LRSPEHVAYRKIINIIDVVLLKEYIDMNRYTSGDKFMATKDDRIQARIEPELKLAAEAIFSKIGISSGEAIRMFYSQVTLRGGIPFDVRIPNKATIDAMDELDAGEGERFNSVNDLFESMENDD